MLEHGDAATLEHMVDLVAHVALAKSIGIQHRAAPGGHPRLLPGEIDVLLLVPDVDPALNEKPASDCVGTGEIDAVHDVGREPCQQFTQHVRQRAHVGGDEHPPGS